ncbi:MAG: hypothetical protein CM15mP130_1620 [Verrucomicrobiota bacterium]|nr:MAG: hypothetical protein CM15mP130_1620 [Verrucomicrobiota bacterium]
MNSSFIDRRQFVEALRLGAFALDSTQSLRRSIGCGPKWLRQGQEDHFPAGQGG